ncbi:MAG: hypothetical protein AAFS10_04975 [Myxococcota bacterium]
MLIQPFILRTAVVLSCVTLGMACATPHPHTSAPPQPTKPSTTPTAQDDDTAPPAQSDPPPPPKDTPVHLGTGRGTTTIVIP